MNGPTKVSELTVDQLRELIEEVVEAKLRTLLGDPDAGIEVRPEVIASLKRSLAAARRGERGVPAEDVAKTLRLKW